MPYFVGARGADIGCRVISPLDELLAAVDVEGRAGDRRIRHEVDGQSGDVSRADHASDRQRRAELLAARFQLVAEDHRRQRCVDEPASFWFPSPSFDK